MSKLDRISKAGLWPRGLGADLAAIYCGVSKTTFYARVEAGTYPQPFHNGDLVQWDRFDLDEAIEELKRRSKGIVQQKSSPGPSSLGKELDEWTPGNSGR